MLSVFGDLQRCNALLAAGYFMGIQEPSSGIYEVTISKDGKSFVGKGTSPEIAFDQAADEVNAA